MLCAVAMDANKRTATSAITNHLDAPPLELSLHKQRDGEEADRMREKSLIADAYSISILNDFSISGASIVKEYRQGIQSDYRSTRPSEDHRRRHPTELGVISGAVYRYTGASALRRFTGPACASA